MCLYTHHIVYTTQKTASAKLPNSTTHPHTHTHSPLWTVQRWPPALTVHLALIRQDDLPAATRWVDGQRLLEALLYVGAPHALRVVVQGLIGRVAQPVHVLRGALAATPAAGVHGGAKGSGLCGPRPGPD